MVNKTRVRRTDEELRGATTHLFYEIQMLRGTCQYLALSKDQFTTNVCIESFTSHARALLHFLYPEGKIDADDVLAEDFFDDRAQWEKARGLKMPAALEKIRSRVGKEIVHLTFSRLNVRAETKGWDVVAITGQLNAKLKTFAESASRIERKAREDLARDATDSRIAIRDP